MRGFAIFEQELRALEEALTRGPAVAPPELAAVGQRGPIEVPGDAIGTGDVDTTKFFPANLAGHVLHQSMHSSGCIPDVRTFSTDRGGC